MELPEGMEDFENGLETDDVGQKRYLMYKMLDQVLESHHDEEIEPGERIARLKETDGYMYKLAQEFLNSSSTLEKRRKMEKILDHCDY